MKALAARVAGMSQHDIIELERNGQFSFDIDGVPATIELSDVEIISEDIPGWQVANDGNLTVALDITVSEELRQEGIAREIINRVQNIRKNRDYDIVDKISITFAPNDATDSAIETFKGYIASQVLASEINIAPLDPEAEQEVLDIDDIKLSAVINRNM